MQLRPGSSRLLAVLIVTTILGFTITRVHGQETTAVLTKVWDINRATGGDAPESEVRERAAQNPAVMRLVQQGGTDILWFTIAKGATSLLKLPGPQLGVIDTATNVFTRWDVFDCRDATGQLVVCPYAIPPVAGAPLGLAVASSGDVWMTARNSQVVAVRKLANSDDVVSYRLVAGGSGPFFVDARGIVLRSTGNALVILTAATNAGLQDLVVELPATPVPSAGSGTVTVAAPNAWVLTTGASSTLAGDRVGPYLAVDGPYVWFTEPAFNKIARFDSTTNNLTEWTLPLDYRAPIDIVVRADGVWFTVAGSHIKGEAFGAIGRLVLSGPGATTGRFDFYRRTDPGLGDLYFPQLMSPASNSASDFWVAEQGNNMLLFFRPLAALSSCPAEGCPATGVTRTVSRSTSFGFQVGRNRADRQAVDLDAPPYPSPPVVTSEPLDSVSGNGFLGFALRYDPPSLDQSGEPEPFSVEIVPGSPLRAYATERFDSTPGLYDPATGYTRSTRQRGKVALVEVTSGSFGLSVSCSNQTFYTVTASGTITVSIPPPGVTGGSGSYVRSLSSGGMEIGSGSGPVTVGLPPGSTAVTETVTDRNNPLAQGVCSYTVTLNVVPMLQVDAPADVTVLEAPGGGPTPVSFPDPTIRGGTPPYSWSFTPSGLFPTGTTNVTLTVSDSGSGSNGGTTPPLQTTSKVFRVTVIPRLVVTPPAEPVTATTTGSTANVTLSASLLGISGGTPPYQVVFNPPSGAFAVGTTTVTATVSDSGLDSLRQTASTTFNVVVTQVTFSPPVVTAINTTPSAFPVQADSPLGKVVTFSPVVTKGTYDIASTTCTASPALPSGPSSWSTFPAQATFPVGTTELRCTATDGQGNTSAPLSRNIIVTAPPAPSWNACYVSTKKPNVGANVRWTVNSDGTITIFTVLTKNYVDNTYGANAIGWPVVHRFSHLTGSDYLRLALYDKNNKKVLEFQLDYFSNVPVPKDDDDFDHNVDDDDEDDDGRHRHWGPHTSYDAKGVRGGNGKMIYGSASNIVAWTTSIDENFNVFGYKLIKDSPATDSRYTVNPQYPNWIYEVTYTVTVRGSAFGGVANFGKAVVVSVHASPSKVGSTSESFKLSTTCLVP